MSVPHRMRSQKLEEGRLSSLYLSASASKSIDESAAYIKKIWFDDKNYKDLIVEYLMQYGKTKKKDIWELLWEKLSDKQKEYKIGDLLAVLKRIIISIRIQLISNVHIEY